MKNNSVTWILNALLGLCLLAAVVLCLQFIFVTRDSRRFAVYVNQISGFRQGMLSLGSDCLEYSKTHPALDPLLESFGVKVKPAAASAKPAGK